MRSQRRADSYWMLLLASVIAVPMFAGGATAESEFTGSIPNGTRNDSNSRGDGCGHCHVLPNSKSLNAFGSRWNQLGWGPVLAGEDSDGDDVANGWELGDPLGAWRRGEADPGDPALIASPGQAGSVPPVILASPLEIDHSEAPGENLWQTFTVENVGGDCFGNPLGTCTLSFDVSSAEAWLSFDPELADLGPFEVQEIDILFTTDGLFGDHEGTATVSAPGVSNSPQEILVSLTIPEPRATALQASVLLVLSAIKRRVRSPSHAS